MGTIRRRRYSRDLRMRVIHQRHKLRRPMSQIAADLDMSLRVVERILNHWREIGDVCRVPKRRERIKALSSAHAEVRIGIHIVIHSFLTALGSLFLPSSSGTPTYISMRSRKSSGSSTTYLHLSALYGRRQSFWV